MSDFLKAILVWVTVMLVSLSVGNLVSQPKEPWWKSQMLVTQHPNGVQCHSWKPQFSRHDWAISCVKVK